MVRSMQADGSQPGDDCRRVRRQDRNSQAQHRQNPNTAAKYGVMSIPTLNVYQGGEVVQTIVGAKPKAALERELADFIYA